MTTLNLYPESTVYTIVVKESECESRLVSVMFELM